MCVYMGRGKKVYIIPGLILTLSKKKSLLITESRIILRLNTCYIITSIKFIFFFKTNLS